MTVSGRRWVVPGYTELRSLGGGGFGEVVVASQDASGTLVAIKYLHPDLLGDPEHTAAFRAEARTLAGLDSPHVVRLYEYVEGPAGAAIVMELVEGVTLAGLLEREGKTSPQAALVVLYGSLLGLAAAHAKGVVHRDYKPANVLVNGQGVSKLTDFGIAALAGNRPVPTGTLRYMPPEQFEGATASPAGDVYAATVTFYQCLAGRVPFDGQTAEELYGKHKSAEVPMDPVPGPLQPVVARGMAKDPAGRPADAALLAAELREAAAESYGPDWENRGLSHLAEAAALLLALLWPSGGSSVVTGSAVEQVPLRDPGRAGQPPHAAQPAHQGEAARAAHAGQTTGSSGETRAEHLHHLEHLEHLEHVKHEEHLKHLEHVKHEEHLEHVRHEEHLEHVEHEEHLAHLRSEDSGHSTMRRNWKRYRPRNRLQWAAAGGAGLVVVAAVAGIAAAAGGGGGGGTSAFPLGEASVAAHAATGGAGGGSAGAPSTASPVNCITSEGYLLGWVSMPSTPDTMATAVQKTIQYCYLDSPSTPVSVACGALETVRARSYTPGQYITSYFYPCTVKVSGPNASLFSGQYKFELTPSTGEWSDEDD